MEKRKTIARIAVIVVAGLCIFGAMRIAMWKFGIPSGKEVLRERDEVENIVAELTKKESDIFSAKSEVLEKISKILLVQDLEIQGLERSEDIDGKNSKTKLTSPFILTEEWERAELSKMDISVNGREIPKTPSFMSIEFFVNEKDKRQYPISATATWRELTTEQAKLGYWMDEKSASFVRGNPDGTATFFIRLDDKATIEIQTESKNKKDITSEDENVIVKEVSMRFKSDNFAPISEITQDIQNLCNLREPFKIGAWKWRTHYSLPNKAWIKNVIDGGITKWYGLSEWDYGEHLIDGNIVVWNGILASLHIVVDKKQSERVLARIAEYLPNPEGEGFLLKIEEDENFVKITITDQFIVNFSSLWGA